MNGEAHGKIILIGEHSVVYNHPAIAIPFLEGKIHVNLYKSKKDEITSQYYKGSLDGIPDKLSPIKDLIIALKKDVNNKSYCYEIKGNLPIGAGLGSSAAIGAAITKAIFKAANKPLNSETLFNWTQYFEKSAHTNPSGIDALCVNNTNGWYFTKTNFEHLTFDLNAYLIIGNTMHKAPTKESVEHVKMLCEKSKDYQNSIETLGQLTIKSKGAIINHNLKALGNYMNQAMEHLSYLELSTEIIDDLTSSATDHGALGAKLTGGGMGGCVIALCDNLKTANKVKEAWQTKHNIDVWLMALKGD